MNYEKKLFQIAPVIQAQVQVLSLGRVLRARKSYLKILLPNQILLADNYSLEIQSLDI